MMMMESEQSARVSKHNARRPVFLTERLELVTSIAMQFRQQRPRDAFFAAQERDSNHFVNPCPSGMLLLRRRETPIDSISRFSTT